jgi:hypothetical protein
MSSFRDRVKVTIPISFTQIIFPNKWDMWRHPPQGAWKCYGMKERDEEDLERVKKGLNGLRSGLLLD